jgi:hypothetical protein
MGNQRETRLPARRKRTHPPYPAFIFGDSCVDNGQYLNHTLLKSCTRTSPKLWQYFETL